MLCQRPFIYDAIFFSRGAVNGAKLVVLGCFLREIKFLVRNKVVNRCGGCDFGSTQGGYGQFQYGSSTIPCS